MIHIRKNLDLLGHRVEDKVTKAQGVVASIGFDLYGCVQALVNPGLDKDGIIKDSRWFDVSRLMVLTKKPVMERPNFEYGPQAEGKQGAAEKPKHCEAQPRL